MKRRLPAKKLRPAREAPAELRSITGQETWLPSPSLAGVTVTPQTALCVTAVFACVNAIASGVASMPYTISRLLPQGGKAPELDDPRADLLACEPNAETGAHKFWSDLVANRVIYGNGYAEITRDGDGMPNGLHLLDPESTVPMRDGMGRLYYQAVGGPGPNYNRMMNLLAEDVIHVAGVGRDGVNGYNPTRLAECLIGATLAAEVTGASVFGRGGQPVGSLDAPAELGPEGRKTLRELWRAHHAGPFNAGEPVILEEGIKFNPFTVDLEKLQYNETRWQAAKQIAQLFGVPPHKIGILDNATYGSLEEQDLDFYKSTLRIICESIESEVSRKLFTRAERRLYLAQFDMGAIVRGNQQSQDDHTTKMFGVGGLTLNDVIRSNGGNPIGPEGDVRFIPANLVQFGKPAEPTPAQHPAREPDSDPTTGPKPEPNPTPPSEEATASVRAVVLEALNRTVRKEVGALRRASKRPGFEEFVESFYADHEPFLASALAPSLRALAAVTGRSPFDAGGLAQQVALQSRRDLAASADVEALLAAWEQDKAAKVLEMLP